MNIQNYLSRLLSVWVWVGHDVLSYNLDGARLSCNQGDDTQLYFAVAT